jgi:ubiquinone/menaquinone biosynthesis C-methylase UbiE
MDIRTDLCFAISRRMMREPDARTTDYDEYFGWRSQALAASWNRFSDNDINGKDVLDFGCGDGSLALFLAATRKPRSITGVDLITEAIDRANETLATMEPPVTAEMHFIYGSTDGLPVDDASHDTLLAFDCVEHIMEPAPIIAEWHRVLRSGGKVLIEWFPFKGPWGPHMTGLIPIPWAHVIFGERAMMRTAAKLYDLPNHVAQAWDLDADGKKLPNKWKQWQSFKDQDYLNELDIAGFRRLALDHGFEITRLEKHGINGSALKSAIGAATMALPLVGEYFVSHTLIELTKAA